MTEKRYDGPPEMQLTPGAEYYANLRTEKGDMRARLFAEQAPVTVNNFVFLARDGYFDGTTFHRAIKGFVVQGGDPTGTGTGGPGYSIPDEFSAELRHDRPGILSMANAGPGTGGSSSSSPTPPPRTSTTGTPSSARWSRAWRLWTVSASAIRSVTGSPETAARAWR